MYYLVLAKWWLVHYNYSRQVLIETKLVIVASNKHSFINIRSTPEQWIILGIDKHKGTTLPAAMIAYTI